MDILNKHPDFELCSICDVNKPEIPGTENIPFFHKYQELLNTDIDAVFVATPNMYSPDIVISALDKNKHVFCEKPPGRTVADIKKIIAAEKRHKNQILKFGFNHRYHGAILDAKTAVDSGKYGKIMWMRGIYGKSGGIGFENQWRSDRKKSGGGILLDQGIHLIDLFRFFCGDFSEIKSFVTRSFWDIDLEDNAFAILRNDKNQVAMIHSSSTQWKHTFLLEIYLEEGYVVIQGILSSTRSYGNGEKLITAIKQFDDESRAVGNPRETVTYYDQDRSWEFEIDEFAGCIKNHTKVVHGDSRDALKVMEMVHGIYANDTSGLHKK